MKKITLKDISEQSGYSLVTVHRAMNNKEGVSEEVRREILSLAERMGYTTNYIASALRRRQVNIAVVMPRDMKKQYFHYLWQGYRDYAAGISQYNINMLEYSYTPGHEEEQLELLNTLYYTKGNFLDGLIVTPEVNSADIKCVISKFTARGVTVVLVDNDLRDSGRLCCIAPNDTNTGQLAAEFMNMALSGRTGTILVAKGNEDSLSHKYNLEGFSDYIRAHNQELTLLCMDECEDRAENKKMLKETLKSRRDIIAAYSVRARNTIPLCEAVMETGRRNQVFLVGSDLFPESAQMLKQGVLKAIVYKNPYQKGCRALEILFEHLIKGISPQRDMAYVPITLILQSNMIFYKDFI